MRDVETVNANLETTFTRVWRERMDGVPILNSRLVVEAVATRPWNEHWLSVLVTPWFINLMLLPQIEAPNWISLKPGEKMFHRFPAGRFEFIAADEPGLGRYLMCSLFSPVLEFDTQDAARIAAEAAMGALFDGGIDEANAEAAREPSHSPQKAPDPAPVSAPLSRRGFLSGRSPPRDGNAT